MMYVKLDGNEWADRLGDRRALLYIYMCKISKPWSLRIILSEFGI